MSAQNQPSFEAVRRDMYRLLGDCQDLAATNYAPGSGPDKAQGRAMGRALKAIAAAKDALNFAAI